MASKALVAFVLEWTRLQRLREEARIMAGFNALAWDQEVSIRMAPYWSALTPEETVLVLLGGKV